MDGFEMNHRILQIFEDMNIQLNVDTDKNNEMTTSANGGDLNIVSPFHKENVKKHRNSKTRKACGNASDSSDSDHDNAKGTPPLLYHRVDNIRFSSPSSSSDEDDVPNDISTPIPSATTNTDSLLFQDNKNEETCSKIPAKRKATPEIWFQNRAKTLRNFGKAYLSCNNTFVPERSIKPPCTEKCKLKCVEKITALQRKTIFENFWGMGNLQKQRLFISKQMSEIKPRYSYKIHNSNRGLNNAYHFTVEQQKIRVCKHFFKATLDISDSCIKTVIRKNKNRNNTSKANLSDNRGKHGHHRTLDPVIKDGVRHHVNSYLKIESNYIQASKKQPQGKSIADLHRHYAMECHAKNVPGATYECYNRIFNEEIKSIKMRRQNQTSS